MTHFKTITHNCIEAGSSQKRKPKSPMEGSLYSMSPIIRKINKAITMSLYTCCSCFRCSVTKSCPTLWDRMDYSPPGSSVHGISQQEYWSGVPFPSSEALSNPGIEPKSPALQADYLPTEPPGKSVCLLKCCQPAFEIGICSLG